MSFSLARLSPKILLLRSLVLLVQRGKR
ncbi:TPA: hypothetical protein N0F65_009996 [Lagenidium giganteum]|uniref:Uncharacterized protein n=1 Tax=Lagenidium giganteum TaxID=4803 RepID=A0AAV2ZKV0_9STRA|nr:TPA: hypothetical protein N0F65_009996 [Lagenidium giganteum]